MKRFFNAKILCKEMGAIGDGQPMTLFMIRDDGTKPSTDEVIRAAVGLGYQHIMVLGVEETTDPSVKS